MDQKYRIAVIGRDGQVSRSIALLMGQCGHEVVVLARPEFDLRDRVKVIEAIGNAHPALVINSAGYTAVDRAEDEPDMAWAVNAGGAEAAGVASAAIGVPIIHFSTDYVFGGTSATPYVETDTTGPANVYGASKLEGERLIAATNPRHVILRTSWVFSPYGNNFVKTILMLAASRPELSVVDDQRGNPTFAADLASAVMALVPRLVGDDRLPESYGVFHAANSGATTWCGFARAIMDEAKARGAPHAPVRAIANKGHITKARRPKFSMLSTAKLERVHGIALRSWDAALEDCLDDLIGARRN